MGEIIYNKFFGKLILSKYIPKDDRKYTHSIAVAKFAKRVADRISHKNPELSHLDSNLVEFLGLVHDIGYSVNPKLHELHTIDLLIKEGVPKNIAEMTSHGSILEQYGRTLGDPKKFYPRQLEGMILTYADMTVNQRPMYMEQRVIEIKDRLEQETMDDMYREDIIKGMEKAFPRFLRYESLILELAGVRNYTHFGVRKVRINKGSKNSRRKKLK